jgi:hypothetical protein
MLVPWLLETRGLLHVNCLFDVGVGVCAGEINVLSFEVVFCGKCE